MKKQTCATLILLFALAIAACGGAPAAAAEPQPAPAAEAEPTAAPTQAWEPIPCKVVFDSDRDGNWEIYIMGPDGENPLNLSSNPADDFNPAISPDGKRITFASNRESDQGGGQNIYVMNADGSDLRQLTFQGGSDGPSWSHDGAMIVYSNNGDIYFTDAMDGSNPKQVTSTPDIEDKEPKWSPDGSKLTWLSGQDGHYDVLVSSPDESDVHPVTDNGSINHVAWTVDGRLLTDSWGWKDKEEFCHNCVVETNGEYIEDAGGKGEVQRFLPFWNGKGDRVELIEGSLDGGPSEIYLVGEIFPDLFFNMTNNPAWDRNPDWPAKCGPEYVPTAQDLQPAQEQPAEPAPQAQATQPKNPEDITIGYVGDTTEQKLADLKQACEELKIECVKADSYPAAAELGVDAIISFANKWGILGDYPIYHEVASKGMPIYMLDAESGDQGIYNLSVETDALLASMEWMFEQMDGQGEMVYFNFGSNGFDEELIVKELESNPGIKATAIPATYEDMSVASQEKINALLSENPALGAIWANEMPEDIFWAVNNWQGEHSPAILCSARQDILESWKNMVIEKPAFNCFAVIKPGGNAYEAVYVAYYRLTGMELDPAALGGEYGNTLIYDYPRITNENLDEWLGKLGELRMNEWGGLEIPPMTPEEILDKWFLD